METVTDSYAHVLLFACRNAAFLSRLHAPAQKRIWKWQTHTISTQVVRVAGQVQ
jgi:hypothetical protein